MQRVLLEGCPTRTILVSVVNRNDIIADAQRANSIRYLRLCSFASCCLTMPLYCSASKQPSNHSLV